MPGGHVWHNWAGYSSLAVLGNGSTAPLALLYARNEIQDWPIPVFVAKGITFTTVPVAV